METAKPGKYIRAQSIHLIAEIAVNHLRHGLEVHLLQVNTGINLS
jgi:hypothetical protein